MTTGGDYALLPEDFNEVPCEIEGESVPVCMLERNLQERCGVPLARAKRRHKWRSLYLLSKEKVWEKIAKELVQEWQDIVWRTILSSFKNHYKPWYRFMGKFLTL